MTKQKISPDIYANIKLYPSSEGGRTQPIKDGFGCPAKIGEDFFDCRIHLEDESIQPGDSRKNIPIKFLSPELVKPLLRTGDTFFFGSPKFLERL